MSGDARVYACPIPCDRALAGAWPLASTAMGFREVAVLRCGAPPEVLPAEAAAAAYPQLAAPIARAAAARSPVAGLAMDRPTVMGVVNVTPDSFSDGGRLESAAAAHAHARALAAAGAGVLDIGGESTRPGAEPVPVAEEIARVRPVIEAIVADPDISVPVSIDTRNAATAAAAREAGARILNDVSALGHDPGMAAAAVAFDGLCLMHAQGDPQTMQADPRYEDVLLEVYDFLEARLAAAERAGAARGQIWIDPGIGFGKRLEHNLALLRHLALFHTLGAPLLLGVSRKGFIGTLSGEAQADRRAPGSIAAGLYGLGQGVHILRVHDVAETAQAVAVWQALAAGGVPPRGQGGAP
ncbi:MAG: dihydropteroate synthase [Pseudomonadota bacterium]